MLLGDKVKEDEMGGTYGTHERDEKWIQYFGLKVWRKETTWKTWARMEE
jgi:hypothetical protein